MSAGNLEFDSARIGDPTAIVSTFKVLLVQPTTIASRNGEVVNFTARPRQLTTASAAVRRVEQDMLANLDASEQDQMRHLLTACIAALTEPPASAM
jgi:hypothetical protein